MKKYLIQLSKGVIRVIAYVTIILIVGLLASLSGCSRESTTTKTEIPVAVRVTRPEVRDMSEYVSYTGIVHASDEYQVIARVQGTVASLPMAEGRSIHTNDTLIVLSTPELEAVVARLKAEFSYWDERFAEDKRLESKGAISREQVDASKRAYSSSKAALQEAESQLAKATERAFFDGYMLKHFVDPGQAVIPGQPLVQIGSKVLEAHAEVVQENIGQSITPGSFAVVHDSRGKQYRSQVLDVASVTTGRSRTFTVTVSLPPSANNLYRVGEALVVDFIIESSNQTLSIPTSAVLNRKTEPTIYLVKENRAIKTSVRIGIQQSEYIAVDFDWNGNDNVVISNVASLSDGDLVYPVLVERR